MAGAHEIPMFLLESRPLIKAGVYGQWQVMLSAGLLSLDDVECMKDELGQSPSKKLQYRARQHPEHGDMVIEITEPVKASA